MMFRRKIEEIKVKKETAKQNKDAERKEIERKCYLIGCPLSSKEKECQKKIANYDFQTWSGDEEHSEFNPIVLDVIHNLLLGLNCAHLIEEPGMPPTESKKVSQKHMREYGGFVQEYAQKFSRTEHEANLVTDESRLVLLKRGAECEFINSLFEARNFPWDYWMNFYGFVEYPFGLENKTALELKQELNSKPHDIRISYENCNTIMHIEINLETIKIDEFITNIRSACEKNGKELILERYPETSAQ